jgi:hypothetical protein
MPRGRRPGRPNKKTAAKKRGRGRPKGSTTKKKAAKKRAASSDGEITRKVLLKRHKTFVSEVGTRIITASKIKEYFKEIGIRTSSEMTEFVASEVYKLMKKSAVRALQNGRKTVRPWDL